MRFFAAVLTLVPACFAQTPSAQEIRAIAERGYAFAYPIVLMEYTRRGTPFSNDFNHLQEFPNDTFRQVIRPNADTLYSSAWLDLSKEPVLLQLPDTHGRYYLMQMMDAWTDTFAAPGARTTGTGEGWFAIVGPNWKGTLPAKAQRIDAPTNMVWVLGRTQTNSASDYEYVHSIQRGYRMKLLSQYPDGQPPRRPGRGRGMGAGERPPVAVSKLSAEEFFTTFASLLAANPPHAGDEAMMADLKKIGIEPGKPFHADSLGAEGMKALEEGSRSAGARLETATSRIGQPGPTGWTGGGGRVGRYGTDYAARAVVARIGLGANPPEDAVYLNCNRTGSGQALDGAKAYRIHFDKDKLPPVRAFWSVTMYSADGYFVKNPINRFAIGDRDALKKNADGSIDIYIQASSPGADRESNWLPSEAGIFNLSMRLYWPKDEILQGKWAPPAVVSADAR